MELMEEITHFTHLMSEGIIIRRETMTNKNYKFKTIR